MRGWKVWNTWEYARLFGGHLPKFYGQGELTEEEIEREQAMPARARYLVAFRVDHYGRRMVRWFGSVREMVGYMREWGLGVTDIISIDERPWSFDQRQPCWCVQVYDPAYGTVSSKEGYRQRLYFPSEEAADRWIDGMPANFRLFDCYPTTRRVQFCAPYGNTTKVPFNFR